MPHIDRKSLDSFVQDDIEMLGDLASLFAQAFGDCTARLNYAIDNHDTSTLLDTTHQLKGRLGYFSATGLQEMACAIELKGKQNQLNDVRPMIVQLLAGIEEMISELRQITGLPLAYASDE